MHPANARVQLQPNQIEARGAATRHPSLGCRLQRSLCGTTTTVGGPHGGAIGVLHGAHIAGRQLNERLCLPGEADEFDIDRLLAIDVNDGAKIAPAEAVFWEIAFKDDSIEFANAHGAHAGYAVMRRGELPSEGMSQTVTTG